MLQTWHLSSASGDTITLTFQSMHLQLWDDGCHDYVEVIHGSSTQRFCGSQLPAPISSSGNMEVTFSSDNIVAWTGFLATACCDLTVTIGKINFVDTRNTESSIIAETTIYSLNTIPGLLDFIPNSEDFF